MKTINSLRLIISLIAFAAFMLVLKSCKKSDDGTVNSQSSEAARAAAIKAVTERYGNVSAGIIYKVNKEAKELFYRNASGNMISLNSISPTSSGVAAPCTFNCSNTTNPANLYLVYSVSFVQRTYLCESIADKSRLTANWVISVPFTPLTSFGGNISTGNIKVTSPSSAVVNYNNNAITIRNLGADPACSANSLYEIVYSALGVPNSYFGSGMLIDVSLNLYNNCSIVGNLVATGYLSAPDLSLVAHQPCNRVEKVWINPGSGTNPATAAGDYILCTNPSGFTPIDNHQLEYRKKTSATSSQWGDQTGAAAIVRNGVPVGTSTPSPTINPYTGVSNLVSMTNGSGTWLVRYRNVKTSVCNVITPLGALWSPPYYWVVEVWTL